MEREDDLGQRMPAFGGASVPEDGLFEIRLDVHSFLKDIGGVVLGSNVAFSGGVQHQAEAPLRIRRKAGADTLEQPDAEGIESAGAAAVGRIAEMAARRVEVRLDAETLRIHAEKEERRLGIPVPRQAREHRQGRGVVAALEGVQGAGVFGRQVAALSRVGQVPAEGCVELVFDLVGHVVEPVLIHRPHTLLSG